MVRKLPLPSLSSYNGPRSLLYAVEMLHSWGVPERNVRLVPCLHNFAFGEVLPCEVRIPQEDAHATPFDGAALSVRLGLNVRGDNRLAWLYPLVAVGLPPTGMPREEVRPPRAPQSEAAEDRPFAEHLLAWFMDAFVQELSDDQSAWSNEEPAERLARQLRQQFPRLAGSGAASEASAFDRIRAGDFEHDYRTRPVGAIRSGPPAEPDPYEPEVDMARDLAEVFHTRAFLALACADMLGSFEFDPRVQPDGRATLVTIGPNSRPDDVAEWLNTYPHVPRELFPRQRADGDGYFREYPEREILYVRDPVVNWTADDPAVQSLYQHVRKEYEPEPAYRTTAAPPRASRTDDITPEEMVAWAQAYVPDFLASYPRQRSVMGGLSLSGILLGLINDWLDEGQFLGLSRSDFERFDGAEQAILCVLLLWRRHLLDFAALFSAAARLLAHPGAKVQIRQFIPLPSRIGTPLAQIGKTMVLGGASAFHSPEAVVQVPCDRTGGPDAEAIEAKLEILRRLFVPVHIPVRYEWGVGWVDLNPPTFQLDPTEAIRKLGGRTAGQVRSDLPWPDPADAQDRRPA